MLTASVSRLCRVSVLRAMCFEVCNLGLKASKFQSLRGLQNFRLEGTYNRFVWIWIQ